MEYSTNKNKVSTLRRDSSYKNLSYQESLDNFQNAPMCNVKNGFSLSKTQKIVEL